MTLEKIAEAEAARDELAAALKRNGIVLPSLSVDPLSYSSEPPRPLIELGRCNPETARRLAAVIGGRGGRS
ncbi:hypothetical protein ADL22_05975 [Streptomyces sp. NRRL F-4489]|uniref:hypothetical protein n=1 Tax=Streptomyces sp. NRRL F-4489 TaxID=1609095 RepID=UPI0007473687|nr:hypothetical protein [Streptomyces sp. NRRL F-4489]KUL51635.1 hypothetical protein ADL22_05975 [Streptomyces sp. NRRL F-4489]